MYDAIDCSNDFGINILVGKEFGRYTVYTYILLVLMQDVGRHLEFLKYILPMQSYSCCCPDGFEYNYLLRAKRPR